jgi:hypothetical protein
VLKLFMIALITLPSAGLAASADKTAAEAEKRERRICKRETAIGSNVVAKRICLTAEEWRLAEQFNRRNVQDWQAAIDGAQRAN